MGGGGVRQKVGRRSTGNCESTRSVNEESVQDVSGGARRGPKGSGATGRREVRAGVTEEGQRPYVTDGGQSDGNWNDKGDDPHDKEFDGIRHRSEEVRREVYRGMVPVERVGK